MSSGGRRDFGGGGEIKLAKLAEANEAYDEAYAVKKDWQKRIVEYMCDEEKTKSYPGLKNEIIRKERTDILQASGKFYELSILNTLEQYFVDEEGKFLSIWRAILIVDEYIKKVYDQAYDRLSTLNHRCGKRSCTALQINRAFDMYLKQINKNADEAEEAAANAAMHTLYVAAVKVENS